jgi:hypothetical protein
MVVSARMEIEQRSQFLALRLGKRIDKLTFNLLQLEHAPGLEDPKTSIFVDNDTNGEASP